MLKTTNKLQSIFNIFFCFPPLCSLSLSLSLSLSEALVVDVGALSEPAYCCLGSPVHDCTSIPVTGSVRLFFPFTCGSISIADLSRNSFIPTSLFAYIHTGLAVTRMAPHRRVYWIYFFSLVSQINRLSFMFVFTAGGCSLTRCM